MVSEFDFENLLVKTSEFMVLENLALKTRKNYLYNISKFLMWIRDNSLFIGSEPVKRYFLFLSGKYDVNTVRQIRASLLYFFKVNEFNVNIDLLPSPKRKKLLPRVLSKQEILSMIDLCGNVKHKLLISLLYSSGLRVSEIVNLHRKDINPYECTIFVRQAKGSKDRYTVFAHSVKGLLTDYLCETTFTTPYIFEGRNGKYSVKTIQEISKKVSSHLNKRVTPHMLRHSFATHLLEGGTDIKYIKELLGHSKLETTNVYVRVAKTNFLKVKNPLD